MRLITITLSLAALTGCISGNWTATTNVLSGCGEGEESTWFVDLDDDGWGEPYLVTATGAGGTTTAPARGVLACDAADAVQGLLDLDAEGSGGAGLLVSGEFGVATNNRDCVDDGRLYSDPANVSGRTGSICPSQLVTSTDETGTPLPIIYTAYASAGREYVVIHDETDGGRTPAVWGDLAADACGPYGWGGGLLGESPLTSGGELEALGSLLSISDSPGPTLNALRDALLVQNVAANWAGYVAIVNHDGTEGSLGTGFWWETYTDGQVTYTPEEDVRVAGSGTNYDVCGGALPDPLEYSRLALILDDSGQWCIGLPADADRVGAAEYGPRSGHFVCERPLADPADWAGVSEPIVPS